MFRKISFLLFAMALFVNLNAVAARATVLYSDVTSDSYNGSNGVFPVYGTTLWPAGPVAAASEFTPTATGNVTNIDVLMDYRNYPGSTNQFTVEVLSSSSNAPGSVLWSSSVTYTAPTNYTTGTLINVSVSGLTLTAGQNYFLAVVASDPNSDMDWHVDYNGATGVDYFLYPGGWSKYSDNAYMGTFDVLSNTEPTTVPEPSTLLLLGAGFAGIGLMRRKIRK